MSATNSLRRLEAAGFTREQVEAILDLLAGELVVRTGLKAELAELRAEMLKGAIGLVLANAASTFAIVHMVVGR